MTTSRFSEDCYLRHSSHALCFWTPPDPPPPDEDVGDARSGSEAISSPVSGVVAALSTLQGPKIPSVLLAYTG